MTIINSPNNETIKNTARLKKTRERKERGIFIVDGQREIDLAVKAGLEVETLFFCSELIKKTEGKANGFFGIEEEKLIETSETAFNKICYKESPDGFLALVKTPSKDLNDIKLSEKPLVIVLENVEKPGNLGAIIRTAYAGGADAIIINDNQTDIYNPNVIRASEGLIFKQMVINASLPETVDWLKRHGVKSMAAATCATNKYTDTDLSGPVAIVLGSEADGLSQQWLEKADEKIVIPMNEEMDSLNVSVSAAIILFEALRQRNQ